MIANERSRRAGSGGSGVAAAAGARGRSERREGGVGLAHVAEHMRGREVRARARIEGEDRADGVARPRAEALVRVEVAAVPGWG